MHDDDVTVSSIDPTKLEPGRHVQVVAHGMTRLYTALVLDQKDRFGWRVLRVTGPETKPSIVGIELRCEDYVALGYVDTSVVDHVGPNEEAMSDTICGRRRDAIILAAHVSQKHPSKTSFRGERRVLAPDVFDAGLDMYDSHKLAAILSDVLNTLGVRCMCVGIAAESVHVHVQPTTIYRFAMPRARLLLFRLIQLPARDGATAAIHLVCTL